MAEPDFDAAAFHARLGTRALGRSLIALAAAGSTNDVAWEAHARGAAHGTAVVADAQTRGRGRAGREWHTAPGKGLALSLLVRDAGARRPLGVVPLTAGLALARGLDALGVRARLKWPNDLLLDARKLAGILVESRSGAAAEERALVIGMGVNVSQTADDFPDALAAGAWPPVSLAMAGHALAREAVATAALDALEPLWDALGEGGAAAVLAAWSERADFWGEVLRVRTAHGEVVGRAVRLDPSGALVLAREGGERVTVLAGDVLPAPAPASR